MNRTIHTFGIPDSRHSRKGKRACDAAILEDALLTEHHPDGEAPAMFHYSGTKAVYINHWPGY